MVGTKPQDHWQSGSLSTYALRMSAPAGSGPWSSDLRTTASSQDATAATDQKLPAGVDHFKPFGIGVSNVCSRREQPIALSKQAISTMCGLIWLTGISTAPKHAIASDNNQMILRTLFMSL
jgi:hypothetical protein